LEITDTGDPPVSLPLSAPGPPVSMPSPHGCHAPRLKGAVGTARQRPNSLLPTAPSPCPHSDSAAPIARLLASPHTPSTACPSAPCRRLPRPTYRKVRRAAAFPRRLGRADPLRRCPTYVAIELRAAPPSMPHRAIHAPPSTRR
jgi:hypothetical protein